MRFAWIIFCLCSSLFAAPRVFVTMEGREFSGSVSTKWKWVTPEEKVRALTLEVTIQSSAIGGYERAATKSRRIKPKVSGSELIVFMDGFSEKVLLAGPAGKMILDLKASPDERGVIDENCARLSLKLRSAKKKVPFYVGTSCTETEGSTSLTLSFPHEVDLDNSTIFETKGKGEPWRYFELGNVKQAAGTVAKFTLKLKDDSYEFILEADKPQQQVQAVKTEETPDRINFLGGAGYTLPEISGSDLQAKDGKPTFILRIPHYPMLAGLGGGINADIALPLSKNTQSMSYLQLQLHAGYEIHVGTFKIRPQVGYVIFNQVHDDTQIGLSITDLSGGLHLEIKLGESFYLHVGGMKCGFASQVFSGHYSFELAGIFKNKGSTGFGLGAKLQSFTATSETSITRKYNQMLFYGLLAI